MDEMELVPNITFLTTLCIVLLRMIARIMMVMVLILGPVLDGDLT